MDNLPGDARDLSEALAARAEDLCRRYLPGGRRNGVYWTVGDVHGTPGRSLFVRLVGPASGRGAAGRWCDAATGQRGDLLDLIALAGGHARLRDVLDEARSVLALPPAAPRPAIWAASGQRADTVEAARRLYRAGRLVRGTPAERYLAARGLALDDAAAAVLRFHPAALYRDAPGDPRRTLPALLAPVTDLAGTLTGLHRTFLDPRPGRDADPGLLGKAPVASPRRSLGRLAGHGVRLRRGDGAALLVVGEGIETALSLASLFPRAGIVAALSASQLAILALPPGLARLVVARDNDAAGREAAERLAGRARASSVAVTMLRPRLIDFNADLRRWGPEGVAERVGAQLSGV